MYHEQKYPCFNGLLFLGRGGLLNVAVVNLLAYKGTPKSCVHLEGKNGGREILRTLGFPIEDHNSKPILIICAFIYIVRSWVI